jgi:ABC-2 type transport system permease protein
LIAYIMGGILRGVTISVTALFFAALIVPIPMAHPFYLILFLFVIAGFFASLGIYIGLWAKSWDHMGSITNFIITPLTFLGGVFYSASILPEPWRTLTYLNPLYYMVDGMRYGMLGVSDTPILISLLTILLAWLVLLAGNLLLFYKGWKLRN